MKINRTKYIQDEGKAKQGLSAAGYETGVRAGGRPASPPGPLRRDKGLVAQGRGYGGGGGRVAGWHETTPAAGGAKQVISSDRIR